MKIQWGCGGEEKKDAVMMQWGFNKGWSVKELRMELELSWDTVGMNSGYSGNKTEMWWEAVGMQ